MEQIIYGMLRAFVLAALLVVFPLTANAAKYKQPIHEHPEYQHDPWVTMPMGIVRRFLSYITSFYSDDDNNGDGLHYYRRIQHFAVYEIRKFNEFLARDQSVRETGRRIYWQGIVANNASYKYFIVFRKLHSNGYD